MIISNFAQALATFVLKKDRSKHFSGPVARLTSSLPVSFNRENQVSSNHLKLTNKNITLHVSATKQEI